MPPFLKKVIDFIRYREAPSNDHLEAYPERLHVSALPERRYLKTARFLVICTLLSLTFNFAMCFIYIRNATNVSAIVHNPMSQDTFLYYLDYYDKELKPVQKPVRVIEVLDLIFQNLITDYITQRYQMTGNTQEMLQRWGAQGKVAAYAPKLYEDFEKQAAIDIRRQTRGITQEPYIYMVRSIAETNFYEVIFDVFSLNESGYGVKKCPCKDKTPECLKCMRETAVDVKRYKAYMRVFMDYVEGSNEEIRENINPFFFNIRGLYLYPQVIHPENMWEDVDLISNS